MRLPAALLVPALACPAALADGSLWRCAIGPGSTCSQTTTVDLPLAGTWIGDHDAVTNPGGTRTLPGLFGGSGNQPIPFTSINRSVVTVPTGAPVGAFLARFDPSTGALAIGGLSMDLLDGRVGTIDSSARLTFATFRTVAPSSTFPGVSGVEVPVDSGALTSVVASQLADATTVAAAATDGSWSFTVTVPVQVQVAGTALGSPFEMAMPGELALVGSLRETAEGVSLSGTGSIVRTDPVPPPAPLVAVPFPLPTVLPVGGTANLLMSGTFSEGTSTTSASATIAAGGDQRCLADLDRSAWVDFGDVVTMLLEFGPCAGVCAGDLDGSGTVDLSDAAVLMLDFGPCG
jgi:hypothetical protein